MKRMVVSSFFVLAAIAGILFAGEWPGWRGPLHDGVSTETGLISKWSLQGENLIWRANFTGRSTPVVVNGRVCASGRTGAGITRQEDVACWDAGNGKLLWERKFNLYHTTVPFNRVGWASLAADPETGNVYLHGVGGLFVCMDPKGNIVWQYSLTEMFGHLSGYGGRTDTPVVDENQVILGFVNSGWGEQAPPRHRFFSFDKKTGELLWVSTPGGAAADFNIQPTPVVAIIKGQRLLIGGNGDGGIYAIKARTGEKVWGFQLSKRGLQSAVAVEGTHVIAAHSEENVDEATMGRVVCIDATGTGDITKTGEVWRADRITAGFSSPIVHDGIVYIVDNSANLMALDSSTGKEMWKQNLGTVGKGSPVWADGKLYVTEVNGTFHILQVSRESAKSLDVKHLSMPSGRYAEIYGSPAIANGRIYFTSEEGIYCLGNKKAKRTKSSGRPMALSGEAPVDPAANASTILVAPAEVLIKPGETVSYKARAFDASGHFLREEQVTWTVTGLKGTVDPTGKFTPEGNGAQAGIVNAQLGDLKANARVRVIPDLPWNQDFESFEEGKSPAYWIGAGRKFPVKAREGNKVLSKPPAETGLQTGDVYMGQATMSGYTVQADVLGTKVGRRLPDAGLIANGYTLDLMGNHQRLQIRSWPSVLRVVKNVDFPWQPDVWYTMKMRVDFNGDKAIVKGKVWPKTETEPADWTITTEDPIGIKEGSPGIYGNSVTEIFYDNIKVTRSE